MQGLITALKSKWTYSTFVANYPEFKYLCNKADFKDWRAVTLAKDVHGDKYNYSLWVGVKNKLHMVTTICPTHGEFTQPYRAHVTKGNGCKACAVDSLRLPLEEFKARAAIVHNNYYDYSELKCINNLTSKVVIRCPQHGAFSQAASSHLEGHKCPVCANRKKLNLQEVKSQLQDRDFEVVSYSGNTKPMTLLCEVHGTWSTHKTNVLGKGSGCPKCAVEQGVSKAELYIQEFIESLGFETEKYIMQDAKHIDIYVPNLKIGFEYNGSYWHSDAYKDRSYHINKTLQAQKEGIELFHIWEYEFENSRDIILDMIRSKLGLYRSKVYARKCIVDKAVTNTEAQEFTNKYHIQGHRPASQYIGLRHEGKLIMLASFMNTRGASVYACDTELIRLVSCATVVGGASRLLSCMSKYKILSYARRDYSSGGVYKALGFKFRSLTPPNYKYIKANKIVPRQACMKHKLEDFLGKKLDMSKTEKQLMQDAGYLRIYDCGNLVYVKEIQ